ncbi:hypothetical protein F0562_029502 [Nyssa sinensis]|uniref:Sec-independent protein translocase protein TATA, chloroplastic n=1 Tax=Nyssa sinensis TaxID=561372 RepID=A0A5J5B3B5_9ASTE|nr:hypothetical protein F0562_029502 [Nyssa sinensis]
MEMAISSATFCLSCTPFPRRSLPPLSSSSNSSFFNNTALLTHKNKANRSLVLGRTRTRGLSCNCLFGLGVPELAVIAGVAALVFGPKQLPEVGRSIGKTVKSFQQAAKEFESELKKEPDSVIELPMEKATAASEEEKQDVKVSSTKESS